jgi:hypothetical protein
LKKKISSEYFSDAPKMFPLLFENGKITHDSLKKFLFSQYGTIPPEFQSFFTEEKISEYKLLKKLIPKEENNDPNKRKESTKKEEEKRELVNNSETNKSGNKTENQSEKKEGEVKSEEGNKKKVDDFESKFFDLETKLGIYENSWISFKEDFAKNSKTGIEDPEYIMKNFLVLDGTFQLLIAKADNLKLISEQKNQRRIKEMIDNRFSPLERDLCLVESEIQSKTTKNETTNKGEESNHSVNNEEENDKLTKKEEKGENFERANKEDNKTTNKFERKIGGNGKCIKCNGNLKETNTRKTR